MAFAFGLAWPSSPRPEATLRPTAGESEAQILTSSRWAGEEVDTSTLQSYEIYRGVEPWSAVDDNGNPCLFLIEQSTGTVLEAPCTPSEADLIADVGAWPALDQDFADGLPDGSIIRFHFRGDSVDVFVHEAPTKS